MMNKEALEPRPLYGIGTVARLTGLKPDTLRVWERRYGLGASHKSRTGRRQYTQSDVEHLQMVSALVSSGSRIGEIANSERKTLEMLLRSRGSGAKNAIPEPKPRVVFLGESLCDWLEEHQGCLANVDAKLARFSLAQAQPDCFEEMDRVDCLVVECATLASSQLAMLRQLRQQLQPSKVLVTYRMCNERWLKELQGQDFRAVEFPPDPAYLAFEVGQCVADKLTSQGETDLGELIIAKPRQFSARELSAARRLKSSIDCECPRHISDLIRALANFEEYSASCSVENWHDAAVHSCIYAYAGQARWLMEKALSAVLEERTTEFAQEMQRGHATDNAA
jgi:DNA-binding transcriptional MerR regulator